MSHNSKYYNKRLNKKDARGLTRINDLWNLKNSTQQTELLVEESPSPVQQADQSSVGNELNNDHDVDPQPIQSPSKKIKISPVVTVSTTVSLIESEIEKIKTDTRKAGVRLKYEVVYPWLYFSAGRGGYFCKFCELFGATKTPFMEGGVKNFGTHPTRLLKGHEQSKGHKETMDRYTMSRIKNTNVFKQVCEHAAATNEDERMTTRGALKKIFECVNFMLLQKWAVSANAEKFVRFVSKLGVAELQKYLHDDQDSTLKREVTYLSPTSITQMVMCISDLVERNILSEMRGKPYALLADESTDNANRSQLSVMVKYAIGTGTVTRFLGFIHLSKGDAAHISSSLEQFLMAKNLDLSLMRFLALDGCNTMSGVNTGVQRRMRHLSPFTVFVSCRNHRLALCLAHLIKRFTILQDVDATLLSLWKLFEFSPQKMAVFKHVQTVYGKTPLIITRAATTRWLSHLQACSRFVNRYECILDTLDGIYEEKRDPEVMGIRGNTTNKMIVATILLLCDILKPVNMLSLYLQESNIRFTSLPNHVKLTTDLLHGLIETYQEHIDSDTLNTTDTEFSKCQNIFDEIDDRTDLARRLRVNQHVDQTASPKSFLRETGIPLIYDLIAEIENAFSTGAPVLSHFRVLDPLNLPDLLHDLAEYGHASIQGLVNFYGTAKTDIFQGHTMQEPAMLDQTQLETELKTFKVHLFMLMKNEKLKLQDIQHRFMTDQVLQQCFPSVKQLYELAMLIPPSTAVVERGFSDEQYSDTKEKPTFTTAAGGCDEDLQH
ncbi:hypothetical protein ScPMuIL_014146 [Solemya velum]